MINDKAFNTIKDAHEDLLFDGFSPAKEYTYEKVVDSSIIKAHICLHVVSGIVVHFQECLIVVNSEEGQDPV